MKFLNLLMRFMVYLFLYFLIWILCIWILLTLNSSKLISDSISGLFALAITVTCIVLFVQQMMNTKTKRKANRRITRQPRLNRYENKEVNYQDIKRILKMSWRKLNIIVLLKGTMNISYRGYLRFNRLISIVT